LIELQPDVHILGHGLLEIWNCSFYGVDHRQRRSVRSLGNGNVHGALAVDVRVRRNVVGAVFDCADVAQIDRRARAGTYGRSQQLVEVAPERGIGAGDTRSLAGPHVSRRQHQAGLAHGRDRFIGRDMILLQFAGVERDHDRPLIAAERRRRGDAGQRGKQRTHTVERVVLEFALRAGGAVEDQLSNCHAARVEAGDEWRHRAVRHEGARAVHVADGFGHRLAHVRAFVKHQLHQRRALNAFAFDVIDAGDVEEVILVVISAVAFHLRGVHAAERLRDVYRRVAHLRKDIHRHTLHREPGEQSQREQRDQHRDGARERC
jgi:hypothetical protein